MPEPVEVYKAILEGAGYQHFNLMEMLSVEAAYQLGEEAAFRTKDIIIKSEVVKAENAQLIKQHTALVEALEETEAMYRARKILSNSFDCEAWIHKVRVLLAQAEGGT